MSMRTAKARERQEAALRELLAGIGRALRMAAHEVAQTLVEAGLKAHYEPDGRYRFSGRDGWSNWTGGLFVEVDGIGILHIRPDVEVRDDGGAAIPVEVVHEHERERVRSALSSGHPPRGGDALPGQLPRDAEGLAVEDPRPVRALIVDVKGGELRADPDCGVKVALVPAGPGEAACSHEGAVEFLTVVTLKSLGLRVLTAEEEAEAAKGAKQERRSILDRIGSWR